MFLLIGGVVLIVLATVIAVVALLAPYRAPRPGVDRPFGIDQNIGS